MKNILNNLNIYFQTVPNQLRKIRWIILSLFIILTVIIAIGIPKSKFDMTMDSWFSDDNSVKVALNEFRSEFGSDEDIFLVYKPKDGDIFSEKSLRLAESIRNELLNFRFKLKKNETSQLKRITRINTIVSTKVLKVNKDTLISEKFIGNNFPKDYIAREIIRKKGFKQKDFPLSYFSKDCKYGGILIETDIGTTLLDEEKDNASKKQEVKSSDFDGELGSEDEEIEMDIDQSSSGEKIKFKPVAFEEYLDLMKDLNKIILKPEYTEHFEYFPVGNPPLMEFFMKMMEEMGPLYMTMLIIMVMLLWFLFRSFSAVLWPICIVVLSTVWTVGIFGWLGTTITTMLVLTVMLILAVGIADTIHILSGYLYFRNEGISHREALNLTYLKAGLPCLLTTITTMAGMLALSYTPILHIKVFGFMSAAGVGFAYIFTIYLLPLLMDMWTPVLRKKKNKKSVAIFFKKYIPDFVQIIQNLLENIIPMVRKAPYLYISFFLSIFILCVYGSTKVKVDSNIIETTKPGSSLRRTYEVVDKHMMGTQNLEIFIDMHKENALQDPQVLHAIEEIQNKIETKYKHLVVKTNSLVNIVKDAYKVLNEDREDMYIIPNDPLVLSQTLFLFNNANSKDRKKMVSDDYSKSHISVQLYNSGSYEYTSFFKDVQKDIGLSFKPLKDKYPKKEITVTGGLALMMELTDYISWTQVKSLGLAIAIISLLLIFLFGSFKVGFLSVIPNLIPATMTFGLLGLFDIALDSDTLIIAPVIIGIAVDDTIHFLTHYRAEVLKDGNIIKALENTVKEVGQAITFTTLILGFGFFIMSFSTNMSLVKMGTFGSLAIFTALFCDLFMLPALILITSKPMQSSIT
ncbi:MAG: MMPL family transporter [Deltaproteobacteria bacterium]|nr:MMPL family transporter [Deltaproteobacteria bacterium]